MIYLITLDKAKKALEASEQKAKELGTAVTTTIVDEHGSVIAVSKMDGAIPISPRFSYSKAFTSASLGMPSEGIGAYACEGKPYFGVNTILGGEITPIAGGVPVKIEGKLVGGVGVGGSLDVSQDSQCAQEAARILTE